MGSEFFQVNLQDMFNELGEERVVQILSSFSCPKNKDVEYFLINKALLFSQHGYSKTFLVFWQSEDKTEKELVGYYCLANKEIHVQKKAVSKGMYKKVSNSAKFNYSSDGCTISAILIGQLGKNFTSGNDTLIKGYELLNLALSRIHDILHQIGGKFAYVECEIKEDLIHFYETNGFVSFGKRKLDGDETLIEGEELMQLLIYLHTKKETNK